MGQSLAQIYIHIVFHIDFSKNVEIPEQLNSSLYSYIAGICNKCDSSALEVGGIENHVHILCRLSKNILLTKLLEQVKSGSTKWLKTMFDEFGHDLDKFSWQSGYGAFSVSASQVDVVKKYIENQKKHHAKINYKDEMLKLLKHYDVEYNEEYLWK